MLRVLVTGAKGHMAGRIVPGFRERYELRLTDATPGDGGDEVIVADLLTRDRSELAPLFEGIDVVVHLAYRHSSASTVYDLSVPHIDRFDDELANVVMTNTIYRSAIDAGVRRVVVASSNHAADWYEHAEVRHGLRDMVDVDLVPLADNFYGWSKASYELLGFPYACGTFGRSLEVVHVRIGVPVEIDVPSYFTPEVLAESVGLRAPAGVARLKRDLGGYLSARDGQQLFRRCIDAADIRNHRGIPWLVVYGISDNTRAFWSLANAREVLGYAPEDDADVVFAAELAGVLDNAPGRLRGSDRND